VARIVRSRHRFEASSHLVRLLFAGVEKPPIDIATERTGINVSIAFSSSSRRWLPDKERQDKRLRERWPAATRSRVVDRGQQVR
jgi:hypothetical protein